MWKCLTVCAGVLVFSLLGLAQFSGKWEANLHILPAPSFDYNTFTINYLVQGWQITSTSRITDTAFEKETLEIGGTLGSIYVTGLLEFDPTAPAYQHAKLLSVLTMGGVEFTLTVHNWAYPYLDPWPCTQTGSSYMQYILQVSVEPITVTAKFGDCCSGITFEDVTVSISDLSPCCDISVSGRLTFSKEAGFESMEFSATNLVLCPSCISFDLSVTFTTEGKAISFTPKLEQFADTCFTLYGDVDWNADLHLLQGIEIYGFQIHCDLTDCSYFETKTALAPGTLGFAEDEFEYFKLHVCGPSCCGSDYSAEFVIFFGSGGGPFGMTRVTAKVELPLLTSFTAKVSLEMPIGGDPALDLGWTFTF